MQATASSSAICIVWLSQGTSIHTVSQPPASTPDTLRTESVSEFVIRTTPSFLHHLTDIPTARTLCLWSCQCHKISEWRGCCSHLIPQSVECARGPMPSELQSKSPSFHHLPWTRGCQIHDQGGSLMQGQIALRTNKRGQKAVGQASRRPGEPACAAVGLSSQSHGKAVVRR